MSCSWTALWRRMAKHRYGYIPNPCCSDFVWEKRALGEWGIILWVACFIHEIIHCNTVSSKSTRFRCVLFSVWWLRECACSIQKCIYYLTVHPTKKRNTSHPMNHPNRINHESIQQATHSSTAKPTTTFKARISPLPVFLLYSIHSPPFRMWIHRPPGRLVPLQRFSRSI